MNSVINEVIEAVIGMMNDRHPFAVVTRGALPIGSGITCEVGPSSPAEVYLDKNTYVPLDITLNGKHPDLSTLSNALNDIHSALTRAKEYPKDLEHGRWQIADIANNNLPMIIGREETNVWLMASSLSVRFYWEDD